MKKYKITYQLQFSNKQQKVNKTNRKSPFEIVDIFVEGKYILRI